MNTSSQSHPRLSIIIRSKNSAETLAEVLKALAAQTVQDFELIVADSGSQDQTLEWLAAYPHQLLKIQAQDYFPGKVLNQAASMARGEILVFLNSDVVMLDQDTLAELLAPFANPEVKASFARQVARPEADAWVRRDYLKAFPSQGSAPDWMRYSLPLAAMRRSAWVHMPFYTWAWGSEDTEWGQGAQAKGWQVVYTPQARVMHSHNYTLRQLAGRRFIEGEADAWMQQAAYPLYKLPLRILADGLRDLNAAFKTGSLTELALALPRRAVFHWAHLQGWKHGWQRLKAGSQESSKGQQFVLERHPAVLR
ncbi:glycosyltransferase [bacterium (Candidatus Blackallbacteria) CG17_big_fil_post_rev_8_21_14_2_50_48_46]|uniref:Glycosyltransferase n=1 Tax=bacterium (Candidatus Blackallbacteria) CG17_big_fil_post_rev_8_21_14_2_50_48_46 TaxID=2014261 RepID=A0A2M7G4V0_9BACT|nr:MAG: glycosyltransferase [bacterium (Candidatus Blackallbacteria) CG18_big_fil_WC_8_21_14_2_50_49_26]PIW16937.1 MAG: glycosyltransferase [bacterium (Candidatus Blackallbacteria) CG17_big_fil_post_rev_8_21_14_2_50_48_46]PIW50215.1 MAG: glycosyltransferase [bacterium (Candidatus Blackallbacteria) CG13_big_fil_rev_8_21_14_2_50_49_14]